MIAPQEFRLLCPKARNPDEWALALSEAGQEFDIAPGRRFQMWLAQCCHECAGFTVFEENCNYSAEGLAKTWPNRFAEGGGPNLLARALHRKPMGIANYCYAGRMGNDSPESGDGWQYRGRGPIQVTGKDMYRRCGEAMEIDLCHAPSLLLSPEFGARSAAWVFAVEKQCNALADANDIEAVTRRINGGLNGLADRLHWHRRIASLESAAAVA